MKNISDFGIHVPHVLLPSTSPIEEWSVIACDQYTQDKKYWEDAQAATHGNASTFNLILPEIYLRETDKNERVKKIHNTMQEYLDSNVFADEIKNFIYIERMTDYGRKRSGLIVELDLEAYDWHPESLALVRATEATIPERIPPRKEIRKNAPLESPHIMLLANDKASLLVENAGRIAKAENTTPVYTGNLMMHGGSISGWKIENAQEIIDAVKKLAAENTDSNGNIFLFAVGDGNHSLATAKAVWDDHKHTIPENEWKNSRMRYALVEIVNIFDAGLTFEPIHRVVFDADCDTLVNEITKKICGTERVCKDFNEMANAVAKSTASFGFVFTKNGTTTNKLVETKTEGLAVARFQPVLDQAIENQSKDGKKISIDFIHGSDEIERLGKQHNATAILLPPIKKESFFDTIRDCGVLPRKSFSMGEADEKRFYLECRKL